MQWQSYQEIIDKLARATLKRWMVGIELQDIRQELWTAYFSYLVATPYPTDKMIKAHLKQVAGEYKNKLRDTTQFVTSRVSSTKASAYKNTSERAKEWGIIREAWDNYLTSLPKADAQLLRLCAIGTERSVIAKVLGIHKDTVTERKVKLLAEFKRKVDDSVPTN